MSERPRKKPSKKKRAVSRRRPRAQGGARVSTSVDELKLARQMALAAAIAAVGLGLVATQDSSVGAFAVVGGTLALMLTVHRYGRLGEHGRRARRRRERG
jgi:hypothetical protein